MSVKRTDHTVLVQVTSKGSGGRAQIICGHQALFNDVAQSEFLTSNHFISDNYDVGTIVVARVKLSGTRRLTQLAAKDSDINSIHEFLKIYAKVLPQEAKTYRSRYGIHGSVSDETIDVVYIDRVGEQKGGMGTTLDEVFSNTVPPGFADWQSLVSMIRPQAESEEIEPEVEEDLSSWLENAYVHKKDREALETLRKLSSVSHVAGMLVGGSGYGKTTIGQQMAKEWGMTFYRQDCAGVRDPEEFFGFRAAADGSTVDENGNPLFIPTEFTRHITEGNCVVVLDELNRIDPYISNVLFPLLDHAGRTIVAGHEIVVGPNVIFLATLNLGFQFTGTFTLDTALRNRFMIAILVGPLPMDIEEKILRARGNIDKAMATKIVKFMSELRTATSEGRLSIDASTRVSINLAKLIGAGLSLKQAVTYAVINGVSADEAKIIIDHLNLISRS